MPERLSMAGKMKDMLNYIEALEAPSGQLLFTLKKSVQVITPFKELAADPSGWQEVVDLFETTINQEEKGRGFMQ